MSNSQVREERLRDEQSPKMTQLEMASRALGCLLFGRAVLDGCGLVDLHLLILGRS